MDEYVKRAAIDFPFLNSGRIIDGELYVRMDEIYAEVKQLPAADVAPVVRCKECKHRDPESQSCDHFMSTEMPFPRRHNDFCSYGERREKP